MGTSKKTYDVHFNDSNDSNSEGFKQSIDYCKNWIDFNKLDKSTYFGDYAGGTVSIVCNETGEVAYEKGIKDLQLTTEEKQHLAELTKGIEQKQNFIIPDTIKNVAITEEQKQLLVDGKSVFLENMVSKNGKAFAADVSFSKEKGIIEFDFERSKKNTQEKSEKTALEKPKRHFKI